jgi:hypothetical protein
MVRHHTSGATSSVDPGLDPTEETTERLSPVNPTVQRRFTNPFPVRNVDLTDPTARNRGP